MSIYTVEFWLLIQGAFSFLCGVLWYRARL